MSVSRRAHKGGPQDAKTLEEALEGIAAYVRGMREEYRYDLESTSNSLKKQRLLGQIAACKDIMTYIKDARKQYKEAQ